MNRTMTKNICLVAAFFITAILAVLMMGNNAGATASAASAEFEFAVREIEDPNDETQLSASERALLQAGDYAFEWYIDYSESVSGVGFGAVLHYDMNNFTYVVDGDDYLYLPGSGFVYAVADNPTTGNLSVAAAAGGSVSDGRFITVYFRKTSSSATATMPVQYVNVAKLNADEVPVNIPIPLNTNGYFARIGEINGNSVIDSNDAMALMQALSGIDSITEAQWDTYSNRFPNVTCFAQADANKDGVINTADVNEILSYYSKVLLGTYTGSVGNYVVY